MEFHSGDCVIAPATRRLLRNGTEVEVEAKAFDLIVLLVGNHERALGKQEIIEALWGRRPITDAALSQLIYKARRACGDDGEHQQVIRTIYGRGLQWVAPVQAVVIESPEATITQSIPTAPLAETRGGTPSGTTARHKPFAWLAATVVLAAVCIGLAWWLLPRGIARTPPALPRIALLPIENATGDASQDWATHGLPGLIGSLLGESGGIDVIDPLEVAHAWDFTIPPGSSRIEHTRTVTGAGVVVSGKLGKLADLYQLTLHIDDGSGKQAPDIVLTGTEPGALGVAAIPRIRQVLLPKAPAEHVSGPSPSDPYLAQTFARGMDAAMHGHWADAKPYFALCTKETPDFLPCKLRLGQAQGHSDELPAARQTLQSLLAEARQRKDAHATAQALLGLAGIDLIRNDAADALQQLQQAAPLAREAGDVELETSIALKSANAAAVLKRTDLAAKSLAEARQLIADHHLQERQSALHNSESFVAYSRGDFSAAAEADRAALAASVAIGDAFGAAADAHNLALALMRADRSLEALPLFAEAFRRGNAIGNTEVSFSSGNNLATILLETGLHDRARPIIDRLVRTAEKQKSATWQAYALSLRSDQQWADGQPDDALSDARKAAALADGKQDPWLATMLQFKAALIALSRDRDSLSALSGQFDAMLAAQSHPADFAYWQRLMDALKAAATGDPAAARAALQKAGAVAHPDDPSSYDLRRTGLSIALATNDAGAARIALQDFEPGDCNMADVLQLATRWAQRQGDTALAAKADRRLATLHQTALAALAGNEPGAAAPAGTAGDD
jgi:DNA-binding winged helix-turn-helix (wHTH) protein/tetratricopeptide (TPR) repeat protein